MNRYDHALGKDPDDIEKAEKVVVFGIDSNQLMISNKYRGPYFRIGRDPQRIGILFTDSDHVFTSTYVHYHKAVGYVICDSVPNHQAECCDVFKLNKRVLRVACPVIVYQDHLESSQERLRKRHTVMPWVFGKKVFDLIKEIHKVFPLDQNDYIVCNNGKGFPDYSIQAVGFCKWVDPRCKNKYLLKCDELNKNMKAIIGQDFSDIDVDLINDT